MPPSLGWRRCLLFPEHLPEVLRSPGDLSLALAAITHTYLLFHCYPYMGYMAVELLYPVFKTTPITVDSAGWFAGLLGTAFSAGRYVSFIPWKRLRHNSNISVKKTLMLSLLLSAICSLWFGLSTSYMGALVARFCLGLSNTLSGCIKRIAVDRATEALKMHQKSKEEDEDNHAGHRKVEMAPSLVLSVMSWGSVLGPIVGGLLSNPGAYDEDTFLPDSIENKYPFFLPNFIGSILCLVSFIGVAAFIPNETRHETKVDTIGKLPSSTKGEQQTLLPLKIISNEVKWKERDQVRAQLLKSNIFRLHFLAYWSFSFVVVCVDEAFALFLIGRQSGPGLSPTEIGLLLFAAGLLTSFSQAMSLEKILIWHDRDVVSGYYPGLRMAVLLANVPSVLIPCMLLFDGGTYYEITNAAIQVDGDQILESQTQDSTKDLPGKITPSSFVFLVLLMAVMRKFSSTYFSMIGIATGRVVPTSHRDEASRIMTHGALMARSLAPMVAGALVSFFMTPPGNTKDAFRLWTVIGLGFGLGTAFVTSQLGPAHHHPAREWSNRRKRYLNNRQRWQVHTRLWEVHYDHGSNTVASKWRKLARKVIVVNRVIAALKREEKGEPGLKIASTGGFENAGGALSMRTTWSDHVFKPGIDLEKAKFLILGTSKTDQVCSPYVLNPPLMESIQTHLPWSCSDQNFWLRYSLSRDGDSTAVMEMKIWMAKNTILAIETLEGDVFGCFMANKWQKTGRYELCSESFLWRLKHKRLVPSELDENSLQDDETLDEIYRREGEIEVYPWTGANDECQIFSDTRIGAGGGGDGFGFMIVDGLWRGSSSPCSTYDNPCLVSSSDGTFEVANLEVWAMTPFLLVEDAERSEASRQFISETMDPNSVTSTWAKYI
ncbi:TLD domain containing protein [Nitzschia inconspicua]|uniref:TLD domain containing protein n=1 Tax=Nitzschia inconspicua TaxID=303405 RepID=A0A9K3L3S4_9STRA|nr:TLD domain containing protein [Nitzschia inconspicua]